MPEGTRGNVSVVPRAVDTPAETLRLAVATATDAAGREGNQDVAAALVLGDGRRDGDAEDFLLVVADGMGGHPAGDVASRIALDTLIQAFPALPAGDLGQAMKQAFRKANDAVFAAGEAEPAHTGMGTTLTSALLHGKYATVAHVGDSRAYLLRGDNLTQVTRDHTVASDEVAQGRLSADAARGDPRRNMLTHVIGTNSRLESSLPSIFELTLLPGDRLLLCSDGLTGMLTDEEIRDLLMEDDRQDAADRLVLAANAAGGVDNTTVVVLDVSSKPPPAAGTDPVTGEVTSTNTFADEIVIHGGGFDFRSRGFVVALIAGAVVVGLVIGFVLVARG